MPKITFTIITTLLFMNSIFAQNNSNIIGSYNITSYVDARADLIVLPNNKFIIYYTGGIMLGNWTIVNNILHLSEQKQDRFVLIYGRHEPSLNDSVRIMFSNFEDGNVSIALNEGKDATLTPIFNQNPNCIPPNPTKIFAKPKLFQSLIFVDKTTFQGVLTEEYPNPKGYNDFITLYIGKANKAERNIAYKVEKNAIKDEHGNSHKRKELSQPEIKELEKILAENENNYTTKRIYGNNQYNIRIADFNAMEHLYNYLPQENAYTLKNNYVEGEQNSEEYDYHNMNYVFDYWLIDKKAHNNSNNFIHETQPLFVAECDNYETSHYTTEAIEKLPPKIDLSAKQQARQLHDIAYDYYKEQKYDDAEKYILEALTLDQQEPDYYGLLAYIHARREQYHLVHQIAEEAIALFPSYEMMYDVDAVSYYKEGQFIKCKQRMDQQFALEPISERFYNNYLSVLDTLEQHEEMFPIYNAYLALLKANALEERSPEFSGDIQYIIGKAYRKKGQLAKAIEHLNSAVAIKNDKADYYLERAQIWTDMNNKPNATNDYNNALIYTNDIADKEKIKETIRNNK